MSRTRYPSALRAAWVGALALLVAAACGEDGGTGPGGNSVELQIIAGIAMASNNGIFVHVKTPRTNAINAMPSGDQTNYANWTKLNLNLQNGDVITLSVITAVGDTLMTDQCVVQLGQDPTYARAILFYFTPPNNYADCADGLVDP